MSTDINSLYSNHSGEDSSSQNVPHSKDRAKNRRSPNLSMVNKENDSEKSTEDVQMKTSLNDDNNSNNDDHDIRYNKGKDADDHDGEDDDDDDEDEEYVVEKIVDKRKRNGNIEYLIKWKDWSAEDNTWEPEEHLSCPDLVKEFELEYKKKKEMKEKKKERLKEKVKDRPKENRLRLRETDKDHERLSGKAKEELMKESEKVKESEKLKESSKQSKVDEKSNDNDTLASKKKRLKRLDSISRSPSPHKNHLDTSNKNLYKKSKPIQDSEEKTSRKKEEKLEKYEESDNDEENDEEDGDDDDEEVEMTGFKRGLQAKKILGAIRIDDKLMFLIKWEGSNKQDLVSAKEANVKCPQIVINYYQKRLRWVPEFNTDLNN